jgi:tripartite-type tricarboxylate transporter receptor subunit TctC
VGEAMSEAKHVTRRHAGQLIAALGLPTLGLPSLAHAQTPDWPTKPVRLIVPFPAGGGTDVAARAIGQAWGADIGQTIIVENKAGADGIIAAQEAVKAAPDGHTLFLSTASSMSYVPALKLQPPYDPLADFTPISRTSVFTFVLMVQPSLGVKTVAEFIALAKAKPGEFAYGSGNSTSILLMGQLAQANNLQMTHVPYKGEAPATLDLMGGRLAAMFVTPAVLPQLQKANLVPLAVLPVRSSLLPDVPSIVEAGQSAVNITAWSGLVGPAKMPAELVDKVNRGFTAVLRKPEIVDQFARVGQSSTPSTPAEMAQYLRDQLVIWTKAMRDQAIPQE